MNNSEIEYFITGWEADNDLSKGFTKKADPTQYTLISREITDYINLINDKKTNQAKVLKALNQLKK